MRRRSTIDGRFAGRDLDLSVWTPAYLPAWGSMAEAAGTYAVDTDGLHLSIPVDQPRWCPDRHDGAPRVSGVQSGTWSAPVGSDRGRQPFKDGLRVRERQVTQWGYTPHFGRIEAECRATIWPGSMFSAWMVGLEDQSDRFGEVYLVEVFGDTVRGGEVALGCGVHAFRDAALVEEFSADARTIDVSRTHRYAVDCGTDVTFSVDDVVTKRLDQSPQYPMQLIFGCLRLPRPAPAARHGAGAGGATGVGVGGDLMSEDRSMPTDAFDLARFVSAQDDGGTYDRALAELRRGQKVSHWMWFVFPQVAGLGMSAMSQRYAVSGLAEATAYLEHPVLGARLRGCCEALLAHRGASADDILGPVDGQKLRSSMTLFARAAPAEPVFATVLNQFFGGKQDEASLDRLGGDDAS